MWCMMSDWCVIFLGVGEEHCSADSGGGEVRAPPGTAAGACGGSGGAGGDPLSDQSCGETVQ